MKNANKITILLFITFIVLCILSFASASIIDKVCGNNYTKYVNGFSKTYLGQKILHHYAGLENTRYVVDNDPLRKIKDKANFIAAGLIALLFMVSVSIGLFFILVSNKEEKESGRWSIFWAIFFIVLNGTAIRLVLAYACYGNFDAVSFEMVADIFTKGGNVYATTDRYNYSPIWFIILGLLKKIQFQFPFLPFHFIVRSFLTGIDLLILLFLILIAKHEKLSIIKTSIFFYLNPVSFLLTGYHGQFENLAILMIIIGIFIYFKLRNRPVLGKGLLWVFITAGLLIKHIVIYAVIVCLNYSFKRYWMKIFLFMISAFIFLLLLLPYWSKAHNQIIRNVFDYGSQSGFYGITLLFKWPKLKYLFILSLFIFPLFLRSKDLIKQCLQGTLFFLSFTTGIAIQYFVLPIALGALRPSKGFMIYSLLGTLFILGAPDNLYIPLFNFFGWNVVWISSIYWLVITCRKTTFKPAM